MDVAPGRITTYPAILTNEFGKGRVVYFAGDVTGSYGRFGDPSLRKLLRNAIEWVSRDTLPFEVDAPVAVEVRCFSTGQRYVISMMNYIAGDLRLSSGLGGSTAEDIIPVYDIVVRLRTDRPPRSAFSASSKQQLRFSHENGVVSVQIPKLDTFDLVVLDV
jgi:hypothetical protein